MNNVIGAPQWLKDRMKALRERPFPSAETVQKQFDAVKKWRKENRTECSRHPEYKFDKEPQNDCHDCWDVYHAQNDI